MKKQAEQWLLYAKTDLLTAKQLIDEEDLTTIVTFHSQQCVEKSFKALLELFDQKIPRIHDLRKLYKLVLALGVNISLNPDTLDKLNQVYIDTRYPADFGILPDGIPSIEYACQFKDFSDTIYEQILNIVQNNDSQ